MRVLHVLAQRPGRTGSGVTLDALVREAARAGHEQRVVVGVPADEGALDVGGLAPEHVHPLRFGVGALDFDVPGMSDVMPYPSTRFSAMTAEQLARYRAAWRAHIGGVVARWRPDVVHAHHVWLASALLKDAVDAPVVTHCHATGLRQMELCPHLAGEVRAGCARNEAFAVLHAGHARALRDALGVAQERVHLVGAGYREDLFHEPESPTERARRILYVGKLSAAKGVPELLDAFERLALRDEHVELALAGGGAGATADELRSRAAGLAPRVALLGALDQATLAERMRRSAVCVLPSFYEGLPLVLVEAAASGCRVVATALEGVVARLAEPLGARLELVDPPRLAGVDTPVPAEVPAFVARLEAALERALAQAAAPPVGDSLRAFTWRALFERVEAVWRALAR